jgi:hypothetical protein
MFLLPQVAVYLSVLALNLKSYQLSNALPMVIYSSPLTQTAMAAIPCAAVWMFALRTTGGAAEPVASVV